jgi:hypothetical protein
MSHGCARCATYGSKEQQTAKAEQLAKAIDTMAALREGTNPLFLVAKIWRCCITISSLRVCTSYEDAVAKAVEAFMLLPRADLEYHYYSCWHIGGAEPKPIKGFREDAFKAFKEKQNGTDSK